MKKLLRSMIVIMFVVMFFSSAMAVVSTSASVAGPSVVRAGDTLTMSLNVNGTGLLAVRGEIQFDASQLTYQSSGGILSGWDVTINSQAGNIKFIADDQKLSAPINSVKQLFQLTFKISNSIPVGSVIKITAAGMEASDGLTDSYPANASYSVTIAAPLSTNTNLGSLTVNGGTLTPAFSKSTTSYSLSVPFSVTNIQVTANPEDAGARVNISSPDLIADGVTDLSVTVTAASGAKKVYTINVTRAKDPNYVPSAVDLLSAITVDQASLSPGFTSERLEYVIYVPFEVEKLTLTALPKDDKAQVSIKGDENLQVGKNNRITIECKAESGSVKIYTVAVVRADQFVGLASLTEPTKATTVATTTTTSSTTNATTTAVTTIMTTAGTEPDKNSSANQNGSLKTVLIIVLAVTAAGAVGYVVYLKLLIKRNS